MRRLFSDATAKIDAVDGYSRDRPAWHTTPEMPNAAPTTSKRVSYAI